MVGEAEWKKNPKSKDIIKYNVESREVKNECSGEIVFSAVNVFSQETLPQS